MRHANKYIQFCVNLSTFSWNIAISFVRREKWMAFCNVHWVKRFPVHCCHLWHANTWKYWHLFAQIYQSNPINVAKTMKYHHHILACIAYHDVFVRKFSSETTFYWLLHFFSHSWGIRMPPKSKKSKDKVSDDLVLEPRDHRRLFRLLPLHILRKYTNIRQLIAQEYEARYRKHPTKFYIDRTLANYQEHIKGSNDWSNSILQRLDYIWPKNKTKR